MLDGLLLNFGRFYCSQSFPAGGTKLRSSAGQLLFAYQVPGWMQSIQLPSSHRQQESSTPQSPPEQTSINSRVAKFFQKKTSVSSPVVVAVAGAGVVASAGHEAADGGERQRDQVEQDAEEEEGGGGGEEEEGEEEEEGIEDEDEEEVRRRDGICTNVMSTVTDVVFCKSKVLQTRYFFLIKNQNKPNSTAATEFAPIPTRLSVGFIYPLGVRVGRLPASQSDATGHTSFSFTRCLVLSRGIGGVGFVGFRPLLNCEKLLLFSFRFVLWLLNCYLFCSADSFVVPTKCPSIGVIVIIADFNIFICFKPSLPRIVSSC